MAAMEIMALTHSCDNRELTSFHGKTSLHMGKKTCVRTLLHKCMT